MNSFEISSIKKALIVVAHPDDEVLGCGGLIKRLSNSGSEIEIIFLSDGESSRDMNDSSKAVKARKSSAHEAARILGVSRIHFCDFEDNAMDKSSLLEIICSVEKILLNFEPDLVITHFIGDLNIDHQITSRAVITACRPQPNFSVRALLMFETLSSTEWTHNQKNIFNPNLYVDISDFLSDKLDALKKYDSEIRDWPHPRSIKGLEVLANKRGSDVGVNAAEGFRVQYIKI